MNNEPIPITRDALNRLIAQDTQMLRSFDHYDAEGNLVGTQYDYPDYAGGEYMQEMLDELIADIDVSSSTQVACAWLNWKTGTNYTVTD